MYSKLPRKTSPTAFKLALDKSSSSPTSRIPTSPTSRIPSVNASSKGKENIPPFSNKQCSSASAPLKKTFANAQKGADVEDVKCVGSIAKDGDAFTRPALADLSSIIVEGPESAFVHDLISYDEDWEAGLEAVKISTPKKNRTTCLADITLSCNESFADLSSLLTKRHNDSIEVTRKRLSRGDVHEADISLDAVPDSLTERFEFIDPVEYSCDDEVADRPHNDSIEVTRKRLLEKLTRGAVNEADISLDAVPESLTERIQYIEPLQDFDDVDMADDTFDLSEMLEKLNAPKERLMDSSLSDLMNVEINYSLEFPNTAIGRPPHIFVAKYKRDKKRAAQRAIENQIDRCVLQDECILDIPLQNMAPSLKWGVLEPEQCQAPIQAIPTLIVTSPSGADFAAFQNALPETIEYDEDIIENRLYKYLPLDSSFRNWMIRFHGMDPDVEDEDEEEVDLNEIY